MLTELSLQDYSLVIPGNKLGKAYSLNGLQKYFGLSLQEFLQQDAQHQALSQSAIRRRSGGH